MCVDKFGEPRGFLAFMAKRMRVLPTIIPAAFGLWLLLEQTQAAGALHTPGQQANLLPCKHGYLTVAFAKAATTRAPGYHDESLNPGLPTTGPTDPNGPPG